MRVHANINDNAKTDQTLFSESQLAKYDGSNEYIGVYVAVRVITPILGLRILVLDGAWRSGGRSTTMCTMYLRIGAAMVPEDHTRSCAHILSLCACFH
jgi:hypothetical protein